VESEVKDEGKWRLKLTGVGVEEPCLVDGGDGSELVE